MGDALRGDLLAGGKKSRRRGRRLIWAGDLRLLGQGGYKRAQEACFFLLSV